MVYLHDCLTTAMLLACCLTAAVVHSVPLGSSKAADRAGCHALDHEICDEICKRDDRWYGYCQLWDGSNFSCKCFEYQAPLRGAVCGEANMQEKCKTRCQDDGHALGGYCYPHPTRAAPRGDPRCRCFKDAPFASYDEYWNSR